MLKSRVRSVILDFLLSILGGWKLPDMAIGSPHIAYMRWKVNAPVMPLPNPMGIKGVCVKTNPNLMNFLKKCDVGPILIQ